MQSPQTIEVDSDHATCNGGGGALGHPKVTIALAQKGQGWCSYCNQHFKIKAGAGKGGH
ncbi:NADH dehydrogenase (ubiquinone) Fe-S protein 6 [uncultured Gammaproteobacteria bacterium]